MIEPAEWVEAHEHPAAFAEYLSKREKFDRPAHVELLSQTVAKAVIEGGGRFIVTMPPRHGKSTLCSAWLPFWFLNLFPEKSVMLVSYGADFAKKWGRRVRRLATVHQDRTLMRLSAESRNAGEWETTKGGGMKSVGIDGDATGRGADLLIIDDPVKNAKDARSEVIQQTNWDAWRETFRTRVEPGGTVLIVQTRWHEADLAGKLLTADASRAGKSWSVINFPAIAEESDVLGRQTGDALWPDRFSVEDLEVIRDDPADGVGSNAFAALYQQRPSPAGGDIFKAESFRYFTQDENFFRLATDEGEKRFAKQDCRIFMTADTAATAKTTSDWTVLGKLAVTPENHLLVLDVYRVRLTVPEQWTFLLRKMEEARRWSGYQWTGVEDSPVGKALLQQAALSGIPLKALPCTTDKVTRAQAISVLYENGRVFHPEFASWLAEYEHELLVFPNGQFDDQVDMVAHAGNHMPTAGGAWYEGLVGNAPASEPDPEKRRQFGQNIERGGRGLFEVRGP